MTRRIRNKDESNLTEGQMVHIRGLVFMVKTVKKKTVVLEVLGKVEKI